MNEQNQNPDNRLTKNMDLGKGLELLESKYPSLKRFSWLFMAIAGAIFGALAVFGYYLTFATVYSEAGLGYGIVIFFPLFAFVGLTIGSVPGFVLVKLRGTKSWLSILAGIFVMLATFYELNAYASQTDQSTGRDAAVMAAVMCVYWAVTAGLILKTKIHFQVLIYLGLIIIAFAGIRLAPQLAGRLGQAAFKNQTTQSAAKFAFTPYGTNSSQFKLLGAYTEFESGGESPLVDLLYQGPTGEVKFEDFATPLGYSPPTNCVYYNAPPYPNDPPDNPACPLAFTAPNLSNVYTLDIGAGNQLYIRKGGTVIIVLANGTIDESTAEKIASSLAPVTYGQMKASQQGVSYNISEQQLPPLTNNGCTVASGCTAATKNLKIEWLAPNQERIAAYTSNGLLETIAWSGDTTTQVLSSSGAAIPWSDLAVGDTINVSVTGASTQGITGPITLIRTQK